MSSSPPPAEPGARCGADTDMIGLYLQKEGSNMKRFQVFLFFIAAGVSQLSTANAQWASTTVTTTPQAGQRYVVLGGTLQANSIGCFPLTSFCVDANGIDVNQFANANDVSATFNSLNS